MDNTQISWSDATWNVINGCSVVSAGCQRCYAMRLAGTRLKHIPSRKGLTIDTKTGPVWTGETRFDEKVLDQPLRWKRPRRIFVCAHGDLFHESVSDEDIDRVFAIMALCPQHIFQVLTKRSKRMREYMTSIENGDDGRLHGDGWRDALIEGMAQSIYHARTGDNSVDEWLAVHLPLPNVHIGVSAEDQQRWDERVPDLLSTPAAVRWVSIEPQLGPINMAEVCGGYFFQNPLTGSRWHDAPDGGGATDMLGAKIDWIVDGGESGPGARPALSKWFRSNRDQCERAGTAYHHKQNGAWVEIKGSEMQTGDRMVMEGSDFIRSGQAMRHVGKKAAGRLLDGVEHNGFPA